MLQHTGTDAALDLDSLRRSIAGEAGAPGEPGHDAARPVFNAAVEGRPAVVVRPARADDVAAAVAFAREHGLELAVRGGGHSFAGHGATEGGLLLDMSLMRELDLDLHGRTAWAQAGLTAGEYTTAAGRHGLATGFGDTGTVGIAGLTLGGGMGWLSRRHGLTIDNLVAAEVVTADGDVLLADADHEPDLFWALRGGGGNFGVVTGLRLRLHEVGEVLGGAILLPASPGLLRDVLAWGAEAPEDLTAMVTLAPAPPLPFVPPEQYGKLLVFVLPVHAGDLDEGRRAIASLRALASPVADTVQPLPYPAMFADEGGPARVAVSLRTGFADDLDAIPVEEVFEQVAGSGLERSMAHFRPLGGAMARVPAGATAFAHRDRRFLVNVGAMSEDPADLPRMDEWVARAADAVGVRGPAYVNYLGDAGPERTRDAYPGPTYDRLVAVKRRYDPDNVFRVNHNIAP